MEDIGLVCGTQKCLYRFLSDKALKSVDIRFVCKQRHKGLYSFSSGDRRVKMLDSFSIPEDRNVYIDFFMQ